MCTNVSKSDPGDFEHGSPANKTQTIEMDCATGSPT